MPRLLVISQNYLSENPLDFAGVHVHRQLLKLREYGWEIKVINPQPRVYRYLRQVGHYYPYQSSRDGIAIYRPGVAWFPGIEKYGTWQDRLYSQSVLPAVKRLLPSWKPDVIEVDWITPCGYAGLRLAEQLGIKYILKAHGQDVRRIKSAVAPSVQAYFRTIGNAAAFIIPNGEGLRQELLSTRLFEPAKLVAVPVGVDTNVFRSAATDERARLRAVLGLNADANLWLFVGRWEVEKGSKELTEAALKLLSTASHAHLIVVGPVIDHEARAALSALGDRVRFTGAQTTSEVANWMLVADAFVLPSYKEGLPSALLEAMASGLIPIISAVGGIPNVIQSGVNGLLIKPRNARDLIEVLRAYQANSAVYRSLGQQAQRTIVEHGFTLDQVGEQLNRYLTVCLPVSP